jgi:ADP-ribose pyrophosphatase
LLRRHPIALSTDEKKDLAERRIAGAQVYDGALLKVYRDEVRLPDGSTGYREYIRHPGAVAVLAMFEDGKILLERQFRYPHARDFIELPAGKVDPGEPHLETAKRELLEETGYVAQEWKRLTVIHTAIAYTDEAIEIFLAKKLEKRERKLDQGEFLETLTVDFDEAVAMIRDGRITDSKTVAGLLFYEKWGPAT